MPPITSLYLKNLSIHFKYSGNKDIKIGEGIGVPITHTDTIKFVTPTVIFTLSNVLSTPSSHQNLLSISQFCKQNNASITFFRASFIAKDLSTKASLI